MSLLQALAGTPEAKARACRQQRGEATAWLASTVHDRREARAEQRPTQGADRRLRCRPSAAAAPVWVVPGDAQKEDQTRHGGNHDHAKEDSCPAQDETNASHTQAWMRSTTRKASTHDSSPQCLAHVGMECRQGLFAAMKSLFHSWRKSTHP